MLFIVELYFLKSKCKVLSEVDGSISAPEKLINGSLSIPFCELPVLLVLGKLSIPGLLILIRYPLGASKKLKFPTQPLPATY